MDFLKSNYLWLITALLLYACTGETKEETTAVPLYGEEDIAKENEKANHFFERFFNEQVGRNPLTQAYLGIKKDYDKWDDISDAHAQKELEIKKKDLQWLKDSIDYAALSGQTKISYDLFVTNMENEISDFKYRFHNYPVNQMRGLHSNVPSFLINIHQITDTKDAEAYAARLEKVGELFDELLVGLRQREEKGIVAPKFVFPRVIDDSKNVISGIPFDNSKKNSAIMADFESKVDQLDIGGEEKATLKKRVSTALIEVVKPAYEKLIAFLEEQATRATDKDGAWKFPDGGAFYNNALQRTTTTPLSSNEIHEIGLKEVVRIHSEMREIMKKVGFKGNLHDFFEFMRTDDQFYYPNTAEGKQDYLDSAVAIIDTMRDRLDELFLTKPKANIKVKKVEAFREKSAGTAFYQRPAPDGSRPGLYYANLYNMKNMPKYQMEALAYHEGIPGHHMQLAIAQELEGIPKFRKFQNYTAYVEGWGLYCEYIPKDMGLYSNPYADFGRLAMELWRACRLVVDTGIHEKKWTRQEGIDYYKNNTPDSERDCIRMVERHIVMPSQATAYKIGMLKILELRAKAQEALGDKFDIREFHDVILTNGALPLNTLEDFVDEYIASKQS